jgi:hypothetical protein
VLFEDLLAIFWRSLLLPPSGSSQKEEGFFFDYPEDGGSKFLQNVGNKFLIGIANCKSV